MKQELDSEGPFQDPIVTEIVPLEHFYRAEQEHQDFYRNNPSYGYCRAVIDPKVAKLRATFAHRLKEPDRS